MSTNVPLSNFFKLMAVTVPFTAATAIAANTTSDKLITLPGLLPTDNILGVNLDGPAVVGVFPAAWRAHQILPDTLVVTIANVTAGTPTISARNIRVIVGRVDANQGNFA